MDNQSINSQSTVTSINTIVDDSSSVISSSGSTSTVNHDIGIVNPGGELQNDFFRELLGELFFGDHDAINLVIPSPLDQFAILPLIPMKLGNLYFSFTNPSLFMLPFGTGNLFQLRCLLSRFGPTSASFCY
jgi:hypothetical protein